MSELINKTEVLDLVAAEYQRASKNRADATDTDYDTGNRETAKAILAMLDHLVALPTHADACIEAATYGSCRHDKAQATRQAENVLQVDSDAALASWREWLANEFDIDYNLSTAAARAELLDQWRTMTKDCVFLIDKLPNERDLALLRELWEYCDNYGDGATDSSTAQVAALNFAEPLRQLIARLESKN